MPGSPGIVIKIYPYPGYRASLTEVTEVPGKVRVYEVLRSRDLTELTEFRVRVRKCYQNSQKSRAGMKTMYPSPGICGTGV